MNGARLRLVVNNRETASEWLIRVGILAKQLNAESLKDGGRNGRS